MAHAIRDDLNRSGGGDEDANGFERWCEDLGREKPNAWAVTEKMEHEFSFLWKLNNYSTIVEREEVKSPVLFCPETKHKWQLKVYPRKMTEGIEYFSYRLILVELGDPHSSSRGKVDVTFQFSFLDPDGIPLYENGNRATGPSEFRKYSSSGSKRMPLPTDVFTFGCRRVINNDTLTILLKIWTGGCLKHVLGCPEEELLEEKHHENKGKLVSDMGMLLNNGMATDFDIITNTTTFRVHKCILAARSPWFAAKFNVGPLDEPPKEMHVRFNSVILKNMLEFIYTGEAELLKEKPLPLLIIAEQYKVLSLKECSEEFLSENITIENASDLLVSAHTNKAARLKSHVITFINGNKREVQAMWNFKLVAQHYPNLVKELYMALD